MENKLSKTVDISAFWSTSLWKLDLSQTFVLSNKKNLFDNTKNLTWLSLKKSGLYKSLPYVENLFGNLPRLACLNLQGNSLNTTLVDKHIQNLTQLINLDLSRNILHELHHETFQGVAKSLKYLFVESNRITSVNEFSLPSNLWNRLVTIDMHNNPWICDCRIVWFRRWLRNSTNQKKVTRLDKYECVTLDKKIPIINSMEPTDIQCFEAGTDLWMISVVTCVAIVYITSNIASLLHRYRWHARYFSFVLQVMNDYSIPSILFYLINFC